jgi:hypothetical protein
MSHPSLFMFMSRSTLIAAAALLAPACVAEVPEDVGEEAIGIAEQAAGTAQCVAYRRGVSGTVADATIWQNTPTYNMGASPLIYSGTSVTGGFRQALLYFDVSNIPANVHIDSAVIYLSELHKDTGTTIDLHEILAPWSEDTVTWGNFNQAFNPAPETSFFAWGGGTAQIHVEDVVQRWVDGQAVNRGLLLQEHQQMASSFRSSEHGTVETRPRLKVCYSPL